MLEYILAAIVIAQFIYLFLRIKKMATSLETLQGFATQIDQLATQIQTLIDTLKNNQLTPEQITALVQPLVDKLNGIAQP